MPKQKARRNVQLTKRRRLKVELLAKIARQLELRRKLTST